MSPAVRTYLRGHTLALIQDNQGNKSYIPHFDHQGTVECLTDRTTGAVTDRAASDAWWIPVKRTRQNNFVRCVQKAQGPT